ncbi:lysozyme [Candidatus Williamhamiltonella defendens]|uniref:Lysozyme n=1 Tax=Candidatus Williamhamiltonella defendens TaxID=138072 RepID=A0A2D3TBJ7_9ENTR|nr:lysozyme [Candidatus Hamiltonella defensa]ATW33155.1 lysozyme [Candidatus Hamiltonella defensa]
MNISSNGRSQIKAFEGLKLSAYPCSSNQWSILAMCSYSGVQAGDVITPEKAEAFFREDIPIITAHLNQLIKVRVNQNQFDALVSPIFKIRSRAFAVSTLLKKLNSGDAAGAAAEFPKYCHGTVQGKKMPLPGLVARRKKEKVLFESELKAMKT